MHADTQRFLMPTESTPTPASAPVTKLAAHMHALPFERFVAWPLWPFLDPHTGRPSSLKCMAWAILAAHLVGHAVGDGLAVILCTAMQGSSMWKDYLAKTTVALTGATTVAASFAETRHVEHTITEQRGLTGEALRSLPSREGAHTPGGNE